MTGRILVPGTDPCTQSLGRDRYNQRPLPKDLLGARHGAECFTQLPLTWRGTIVLPDETGALFIPFSNLETAGQGIKETAFGRRAGPWWNLAKTVSSKVGALELMPGALPPPSGPEHHPLPGPRGISLGANADQVQRQPP